MADAITVTVLNAAPVVTISGGLAGPISIAAPIPSISVTVAGTEGLPGSDGAASLPEGGTTGDFLVSNGAGGAVWYDIAGSAEEGEILGHVDGSATWIAAPADGEDGVGVPVGGATGQVLAKASATDYATEWVTPAAGGGGASVYAYCQIRNTDDRTDGDPPNINVADWTDIDFGGINDHIGTGFAATSDSAVTVGFDGTVRVSASIVQYSIAQRAQAMIRITRNGTAVGGVGYGYLRALSAANETSAIAFAVFSVIDGDVIRVQGMQSAAAGTVNQLAGESVFIAERMA